MGARQSTRSRAATNPTPPDGVNRLRVAVVLAAAVPVVNAQFLANPDWEGTLS
jgi:hypothetical protein